MIQRQTVYASTAALTLSQQRALGCSCAGNECHSSTIAHKTTLDPRLSFCLVLTATLTR